MVLNSNFADWPNNTALLKCKTDILIEKSRGKNIYIPVSTQFYRRYLLIASIATWWARRLCHHLSQSLRPESWNPVPPWRFRVQGDGICCEGCVYIMYMYIVFVYIYIHIHCIYIYTDIQNMKMTAIAPFSARMNIHLYQVRWTGRYQAPGFWL